MNNIVVLHTEVIHDAEYITYKRRWLKGAHPHLGKITHGLTGIETVQEFSIIKALRFYEVKPMDINSVIIRYLVSTDYHKGFLETIRTLRDTNLSYEDFMRILRDRQKFGIVTIVAQFEDSIIGTASMFVEHKFIRNGGKVAHVEDVAVRKTNQLKGVGKLLMARLAHEAKEIGCYKIILDCSDENIEFYKKCGYSLKEKQMRMDL